MNHPPLCPKTALRFGRFGSHGIFVGRGHTLFYRFRPDRELLARYQACAWQDRAKRYNRICMRSRKDRKPWDHALRWPSAFDIGEECKRTAEAWREWEKSHEDPA